LSLPSILTSPTSPSFPTRRSSDLYGFPLPVFIRSQNKLVRISQLFLEAINNLFLTPWYYVKRLKVVIRIYAKIGPIFTFKLFGHFFGICGKIPDMAHRRINGILLREVFF